MCFGRVWSTCFTCEARRVVNLVEKPVISHQSEKQANLCFNIGTLLTNNHRYVRICRYHNLIMFTVTTCHRVCNQSSTKGATCGARRACSTGTTEFTPVNSVVNVARTLISVQCFVDHCLPYCPFSFLTIVIIACSLIYTSDYPFGIFKLFLNLRFVFSIIQTSNYQIIIGDW